MPMSNYGSFLDGVSIRGMPIQTLHPGKVWFVNNSTVLPEFGIGGSNVNPGTYEQPFSTLAYAVSRATASRGDIIVLMPGHIENLTTAAAIDVSKAGVAIVGLGAGTLRPKVRFGAAAATYVISAASVSHYNVEFVANFADVAIGLDISGVDGLSFEQCYFTEAGTDLNYVIAMDLATGADDISINKCKFITGDAANTSHINGVAHSGLYITDSIFYANVAQSVVTGLVATSGNATNVEIKRCSFRSNVDGALWVDFNGAANSGVVAECYVSSIDTAGATSTGDFTGGHFFECYVSGDADAFGLVGGGGVVYSN